MPPTPSARSSDTLPDEMAEMSCTSGSSLPRRRTAPLPNCFSMADTASSIAFSFSGFATRSLRWGLLYACTEVSDALQDATGVRHASRKAFRSTAKHAQRAKFFGWAGPRPRDQHCVRVARTLGVLGVLGGCK